MTYPAMLHIPLVAAYLCADCDSIGNCPDQCPACASTILMRLADVLDRKPAQEVAEYTELVPMAA